MKLIVDVAPLDFGSFGVPLRYDYHILGVYIADLLAYLNSPEPTKRWGVYDWVLRKEKIGHPEEWRKDAIKFWHSLGYFPDHIIEEPEIRSGVEAYRGIVGEMGLPYILDGRGSLSSVSAEAVILNQKIQAGGEIIATGYPAHRVGNYWEKYGPKSEFRRQIKTPAGVIFLPFSYFISPESERIQYILNKGKNKRIQEDMNYMVKLVRLALAIGTFDNEKDAVDLQGMVNVAIQSQVSYSKGSYDRNLKERLFREIMEKRALFPLRRMLRDGTGNLGFLGENLFRNKSNEA